MCTMSYKLFLVTVHSRILTSQCECITSVNSSICDAGTEVQSYINMRIFHYSVTSESEVCIKVGVSSKMQTALVPHKE
jgi:hypothetical protein